MCECSTNQYETLSITCFQRLCKRNGIYGLFMSKMQYLLFNQYVYPIEDITVLHVNYVHQKVLILPKWTSHVIIQPKYTDSMHASPVWAFKTRSQRAIHIENRLLKIILFWKIHIISNITESVAIIRLPSNPWAINMKVEQIWDENKKHIE